MLDRQFSSASGAGVKLREGRAAGVRQHALRAAELFREVQGTHLTQMFGLPMADLIAATEAVAAESASLIGDAKPDAARQLSVTLIIA